MASAAPSADSSEYARNRMSAAINNINNNLFTVRQQLERSEYEVEEKKRAITKYEGAIELMRKLRDEEDAVHKAALAARELKQDRATRASAAASSAAPPTTDSESAIRGVRFTERAAQFTEASGNGNGTTPSDAPSLEAER